MVAPSRTSVRTDTLDVPGARLAYELRGSGPLLVLHAAPMDAASFAPLAELLADEYTVLTGDPRGIARSSVDDRERDITPDERADDLAAVLDRVWVDVGAGPAIVLGSSGGAVSALALAQRRPELVRTVIAHEPPLAELVEDRDELRAASEALVRTYLSGDRRGYWVDFLELANIRLPEEVVDMITAPLDEAQAADEHLAVVHMDIPTTFWRPDLSALRDRDRDTDIVVAIGEESTDQLCDRTARALAAALGTAPVLFPGDHTGFAEEPVAFAARLREVLAAG